MDNVVYENVFVVVEDSMVMIKNEWVINWLNCFYKFDICLDCYGLCFNF